MCKWMIWLKNTKSKWVQNECSCIMSVHHHMMKMNDSITQRDHISYTCIWKVREQVSVPATKQRQALHQFSFWDALVRPTSQRNSFYWPKSQAWKTGACMHLILFTFISRSEGESRFKLSFCLIKSSTQFQGTFFACMLLPDITDGRTTVV